MDFDQNSPPTEANEREVVDPITHLPVAIHDHQSSELKHIPESQGDSAPSKHAIDSLLGKEMRKRWWDSARETRDKVRVETALFVAALSGLGALTSAILHFTFGLCFGRRSVWVLLPFETLASILIASGLTMAYLIWDERQPPAPDSLTSQSSIHSPSVTPSSSSTQVNDNITSPESATWLNSLLSSLWPIVNPALFTAIADMLEDSLQATLPKLIHGVRVADIGQGSEPVRVLGIHCLNTDEASIGRNGLKPEGGDFVNLEVTVAYRAKPHDSGTSKPGLRARTANAHLLMQFWVAGGLVLPVWVELTGLLATARMRVSLIPNPPFFSLMTFTFLGQPKVKMVCTPLAKNFLNVMDVPGLSGWLQRSVDAAVAEYVAPRSLRLDLKTMLTGRPKMDTDAIGVVMVTVRSAQGLEGKSTGTFGTSTKRDPYITIGWSKWGKPLWSTRIIIDETNPVWEETTALLVGPTEINAQESIRLQLWDSDRLTADDLRGTVEVPLSEIMSDPKTINKLSERREPLSNTKGSSDLPGTLLWSCGFYSKTTLQQHLSLSDDDKTKIENDITDDAAHKMREAERAERLGKDQIDEQQKQELNDRTDEIIASSKPSVDWPSGILAIRIEKIEGLEVENIQASGVKDDGEDEESDDLPSAYCTVIVNHRRVYKTRTKMKNNSPFFDASTEKFIRDWRNTTVLIAVRDARLHESNALLGVVPLPLPTILSHRSEITQSFPLVGGIGYGRMYVSLIFRSVQLRMPKRLLGWDVGTLEVQPRVCASEDLPGDLRGCRLVFRTMYGKGKMVSHVRPDEAGGDDDGGGDEGGAGFGAQGGECWTTSKRLKDKGRGRGGKNGGALRLPVNRRYSSSVLVLFRKHAVGPDVTAAFCTLWLKDLPDGEESTLTLPVFRVGEGGGALKRGKDNATWDLEGGSVGSLEMKVVLWPGLSGYHQYAADKDQDMADVMDILDGLESVEGVEGENGGGGSDEDGDETDEESEDESDSNDSGSVEAPLVGSSKVGDSPESQKEDASGEGSTKGKFSQWKKSTGQLHRRHRGLMQWRAMRNVAWIGRGVERNVGKLESKVKGVAKRHARGGDVGIEHEV